jgi:hypothetical protein
MSARRRAVLVAAALVAAWLLLAIVQTVRGTLDLAGGRDAAARAEELGQPADLVAGRPLGDLRTARSRFGRAASTFRSPTVLPLRVLPVVGRQLRAARALGHAGRQAAQITIDGVADTRALLEVPRRSGPERLALLRRIAALAKRYNDRLGAVDLGPRRGLLGPVVDARNDAAETLADVRTGLEKAELAATTLARVLAGPTRYLVMATNNSEMRAGSGMALMVGELDLRDGSASIGKMTSVEDVVVPPGVPMDPDLAVNWGRTEPNVEWRNLLLSPRFDASAQLASRMWPAAGRDPVQGVLALDPIALRGVLRATGPVRVNGRSIGSKQVVKELLYRQYLRFSRGDRPERQEELGEIAAKAFDRVNAGSWDPATLADGLAEAARGRHVLAWSPDGAVQSAWAALGIDGAVRQDSLLVAIQSRGGTKLDYFLRARSALRVRRHGGGTDVEVRVEVTNPVPDGQPRYVSGPRAGTGLPEGSYGGLLSVTLPKAASARSVTGGTRFLDGRDGDTRVVATEFSLARGATKTFVLRFRLPRGNRTLRVEPSARVPAVSWTQSSDDWRDSHARTVSW